MLKKIASKKGQVVSGEYVVASVLIIAAVMAMSVYIRRALQARAHDTQRYVMNQASAALGSKVYMEYEPYYVVSYAKTNSYSKDSSSLLAGGLYNKKIDVKQSMTAKSNQLQPGMAQ